MKFEGTWKCTTVESAKAYQKLMFAWGLGCIVNGKTIICGGDFPNPVNIRDYLMNHEIKIEFSMGEERGRRMITTAQIKEIKEILVDLREKVAAAENAAREMVGKLDRERRGTTWDIGNLRDAYEHLRKADDLVLEVAQNWER